MTQYETRLLPESEAELWDEFVRSHPLGSALVTTSSRNWWQANAWKLTPVGAFSGGALVAGLALCVKKIPYLPRAAARISALLPHREDVAGSSMSLLEATEEVARAEGCLEIELRCRVPDAFEVGGVRYRRGVRDALGQLDYSEGTQRKSTFVVSIDSDDSALLGSFSKKCRRDVRKGEREGVVVSNLDRAEDLKTFSELHFQTCVRKGLESQKRSGNYDALLPMFEKGDLRLFAASHAGELMNLALLDVLGVARWEVGASTKALLQGKVPPTGQLLHFEIMRWLRDRGSPYYDLGGAPGPEPIRGHSNYTVWRFKHEFGGAYVDFMPYFQRPLGALGRWLMGSARSLGRLS